MLVISPLTSRLAVVNKFIFGRETAAKGVVVVVVTTWLMIGSTTMPIAVLFSRHLEWWESAARIDSSVAWLTFTGGLLAVREMGEELL